MKTFSETVGRRAFVGAAALAALALPGCTTASFRARGLSDEEASRLAVLDVRPADFFGETGARMGQHAAGAALFPHDARAMGWLFSHV